MEAAEAVIQADYEEWYRHGQRCRYVEDTRDEETEEASTGPKQPSMPPPTHLLSSSSAERTLFIRSLPANFKPSSLISRLRDLQFNCSEKQISVQPSGSRWKVAWVECANSTEATQVPGAKNKVALRLRSRRGRCPLSSL